MTAIVVLIACGGLAAVTAARAFGVSSAGPTRLCFDRGVPVGDAGALTPVPQWLPIGIRCEWTTSEGLVVAGPTWGYTVLVAALILVAAVTLVALLRYNRRSAG